MSTARQRAICNEYGAEFSPPGSNQLVATAPSVMSGHRATAGVRYRDPLDDRSGWILYAPDLEEDIESFVGMHADHFAEERPDVHQFLALPPGWRFSVSESAARAWFDSDVLDDN